MKGISIIGVRVDKEVVPGDDVAELFIEAIGREGLELLDRDIVVVAHKVISKSEGRFADLSEIEPSPKALELSRKLDKDPRLIEVVLRESKDVLKAEAGHIISLTEHNIVCANAGVDRSNAGGSGRVILLPTDPDRSAMRIRVRIRELTGKEVAVVISDTYGRPFRWGVINLAIGFSGIDPYRDYIGIPDRDGYVMKVTRVAIVDEIASAAELVIGQGAENMPFAIIRGVDYQVEEESGYQDLYMPRENWLFR